MLGSWSWLLMEKSWLRSPSRVLTCHRVLIFFACKELTWDCHGHGPTTPVRELSRSFMNLVGISFPSAGMENASNGIQLNLHIKNRAYVTSERNVSSLHLIFFSSNRRFIELCQVEKYSTTQSTSKCDGANKVL
jgi:hypothetical protein